MDWLRLSAESQQTVRTIAVLISLDYSQAEAARMLGLSPKVVSQRLRALREEIEAQADDEDGRREHRPRSRAAA